VKQQREQGFSLIETIIATSLMLVMTASIFQVMHPAQGAFAAEPEVADMQQRLRVGADTLSKDLIMAGAGAYQGLQAGSLGYYFPSVLPFRQGATSDDPPGTFASDRITIIYVPSTTAQTTLSVALSGATTTFTPTVESDCPTDPATGLPAKLCGFAKDQTVLVYDDTGSYNLFTITSVADSTAQMTVKKPTDATATTFPAGSKIVEASSHTYYLKTDIPNKTYQLMHYDGTSNTDVPVVDNVVDLKFAYYGEAQPPIVRKAISDPSPPGTSYGPKPTVVGAATCIFSGATPPTPLLPVLGAAGAQGLVALTAAQLTDGPFCPDNANANRWDADLLRVRKISVTVRVQAALAALRGPAGVLFTRGGTSKDGAKWIPDQELHFDVSPRNLNLGR
jgi:Tfp pilus assembly protein PilW